MGKIYVCSDWHLSHDKDFIFAPRGFKNPFTMNEAIITAHNSIVTNDDDVYFLGDAVMSNVEEGIRCLKRLKGRIHIIRGNHDSDTKVALYKQCHNVVEVVDAKWLQVGNQKFFLSHYPCLTDNCDAEKPLNRRIINICGHLHTKNKFVDMDKGLIYHVDMDAHDCKPVPIETVVKDVRDFLAATPAQQAQMIKGGK